jgi:hypothetical protein
LTYLFVEGTDSRSSNRTDFSCQRIKLVGKRQPSAAFHQGLAFADHVHEFDAGQDISSSSK